MQNRLTGQQRLEIVARLKSDINSYCQQAYGDGPRNHLGASEIGEKCLRRLWYSFRWMHHERFDGRMLRLFNRGHKEEDRFAEWLKGIGCNLQTHDANGKQLRIRDGHHFGGSLDGRMVLPEPYDVAIDFLAEFKTHNDSSFKKLVKNGVKLSKPKHYSQMCTYGADEIYNFDYALYFAINKNDDDIYIECVELDKKLGKANVIKSKDIINSKIAPGRISASAAYSECVYCAKAGICHKGENVDVNCRSCRNASPGDNQSWNCALYGPIPNRDAILAACPNWQEIEHR